jgi:hypothetical protein
LARGQIFPASGGGNPPVTGEFLPSLNFGNASKYLIILLFQKKKGREFTEFQESVRQLLNAARRNQGRIPIPARCIYPSTVARQAIT